MNVNLKFKIYERYGTQCDAAKDFNIREDRLSQIIRGRRQPSEQEKKLISSKLKEKREYLFPESISDNIAI
jgi:hypothetical protein